MGDPTGIGWIDKLDFSNKDNDIYTICICCGNICDNIYINVCMLCYVKYRRKWIADGNDLEDMLSKIQELCKQHRKEIEEVDGIS